MKTLARVQAASGLILGFFGFLSCCGGDALSGSIMFITANVLIWTADVK